ncbi:MAG: hypothetical protein ACTSU5_16400 [Promethearchaeota archaeon]
MEKIYFAHPFDTWKTPEETRIAGVLESRGYEVVNPFDVEHELNEKYDATGFYEKPSYSFAVDIVQEDYETFCGCDEYFGWFPRGITVVGTAIELAWALRQGKRITALCYKPNPFLWVYADALYADYEAFKNDQPLKRGPRQSHSWIRVLQGGVANRNPD